MWPWRQRNQIPPKSRGMSTKLHGVTSQKLIVIFISCITYFALNKVTIVCWVWLWGIWCSGLQSRVVRGEPDVSEEYFSSILRVEEKLKQETSRNRGPAHAFWFCMCFLDFLYDPEDRGDLFFRNIYLGRFKPEALPTEPPCSVYGSYRTHWPQGKLIMEVPAILSMAFVVLLQSLQ
jgi:hypothetical protein